MDYKCHWTQLAHKLTSKASTVFGTFRTLNTVSIISWDETQSDFTLPTWMWKIGPLLPLKSLTNGGITPKFIATFATSFSIKIDAWNLLECTLPSLSNPPQWWYGVVLEAKVIYLGIRGKNLDGKSKFWNWSTLDDVLRILNLQLLCTSTLTLRANILQYRYTNRKFMSFFSLFIETWAMAWHNTIILKHSQLIT